VDAEPIAPTRNWKRFFDATTLINRLYDAAVVHAIAERIDDRWKNRYTSVCYGRRQDMMSVPEHPETSSYGEVVCLRMRLSKDDARSIVSSATVGAARLGPYEVDFDLEDGVAGFRPGGSFNEYAAHSYFQTSMWTRERIGRTKRIGTIDLFGDDLWRLRDDISFLNETRWTPIPLLEHPEKLGDLDEWWPTPIELHAHGGLELTVRIGRDILGASPDRFDISGWLMRDGLLADMVTLSGPGPHRIAIDADGADFTLRIDGIPIDESAGFYIRNVSTRMDVITGGQWLVPGNKARPEMRFPMGSAESQTVSSGTPREPSLRVNAWVVGQRYRADHVAPDSERVYDPEIDAKSVESAFADLRAFGGDQMRPRIAVIDPYALEEPAMQAIMVSATRNGRASVIDVYTSYESRSESDAGEATEAETQREQTRAKARALAQRLATLSHVKIRFFRVNRLHDRFLVVGDRVWHVGPSFNKLGEAFSAIVEMRDSRQIVQIKNYMDRARPDGETT